MMLQKLSMKASNSMPKLGVENTILTALCKGDEQSYYISWSVDFVALSDGRSYI